MAGCRYTIDDFSKWPEIKMQPFVEVACDSISKVFVGPMDGKDVAVRGMYFPNNEFPDAFGRGPVRPVSFFVETCIESRVDGKYLLAVTNGAPLYTMPTLRHISCPSMANTDRLVIVMGLVWAMDDLARAHINRRGCEPGLVRMASGLPFVCGSMPLQPHSANTCNTAFSPPIMHGPGETPDRDADEVYTLGMMMFSVLDAEPPTDEKLYMLSDKWRYRVAKDDGPEWSPRARRQFPGLSRMIDTMRDKHASRRPVMHAVFASIFGAATGAPTSHRFSEKEQAGLGEALIVFKQRLVRAPRLSAGLAPPSVDEVLPQRLAEYTGHKIAYEGDKRRQRERVNKMLKSVSDTLDSMRAAKAAMDGAINNYFSASDRYTAFLASARDQLDGIASFEASDETKDGLPVFAIAEDQKNRIRSMHQTVADGVDEHGRCVSRFRDMVQSSKRKMEETLRLGDPRRYMSRQPSALSHATRGIHTRQATSASITTADLYMNQPNEPYVTVSQQSASKKLTRIVNIRKYLPFADKDTLVTQPTVGPTTELDFQIWAAQVDSGSLTSYTMAGDYNIQYYCILGRQEPVPESL